MSTFVYKARDKRGLSIAGSVEADDELTVIENLKRLGYSVISLEKEGHLKKGLEAFVRRFQATKRTEIIFFTRQLAALIKSGLPITEALSSIAKHVKSEELKEAIEAVNKAIEGGAALSEALSEYPKIFDDLFVSMVRVGETGGILDQILDRLVALYTQEQEVKMRVSSAITYPIILVVAAVGIVSFLLIKIVPKFIVIFETYDAQLPLATKFLLGTSLVFSKFWFPLVAIFIGGTIWVLNYIKTESGKYRFHAFLLNIPYFGEFYLKVIVSRFARTLGALVASGVPILNALSVTEKTINNVVISRVVENISMAVTEGQSLTDPFQASGVFPDMVVQMIAAGEKSGRIDQMFQEIAGYYDQEIEYAMKNLTTILEPLLLMIMGGIVAFIALSVLLPIFNLIKVFRGGI